MRAVNQIMNTLYFVFSAEHSIPDFQMNLNFRQMILAVQIRHFDLLTAANGMC